MTLEQQLLRFAQYKVARAIDNRTGVSMSDDYAASNGKYDRANAAVTHWDRIAEYISRKYCLDHKGQTIVVQPYKAEDLAAFMGANVAQAIDQLGQVAKHKDKGQEVPSYLTQNLAEYRRLANYFAFLCGVNHPFPGVDMLPAELDAAA